MRFFVFATGLVAAVLTLPACGRSSDGNPAEPSVYGNPDLQLPPPVIHFPTTATLVSASPVSGSVLREGEAVQAVVQFTLPPEAYPSTAWLQLAAGRIGFTCGYRELTAWPGPGIPTSLSCQYPVDAYFLARYRELGQDQPLALNFAVYGPGDPPKRYRFYLDLPLTYTAQP